MCLLNSYSLSSALLISARIFFFLASTKVAGCAAPANTRLLHVALEVRKNFVCCSSNKGAIPNLAAAVCAEETERRPEENLFANQDKNHRSKTTRRGKKKQENLTQRYARPWRPYGKKICCEYKLEMWDGSLEAASKVRFPWRTRRMSNLQGRPNARTFSKTYRQGRKEPVLSLLSLGMQKMDELLGISIVADKYVTVYLLASFLFDVHRTCISGQHGTKTNACVSPGNSDWN